MGQVARSKFLAFIKLSDGKYHLAGVGSSTGSVSMNPQTESSQDITQASGTTNVTGYTVSMSLESKVIEDSGNKRGLEVSNYLENIRRKRLVGGDADVDAIFAYVYKPVTGSDTGEVEADLQHCNIQIDEYGGDATSTLNINYTLNVNGDPVLGKAVITDDTETGDKTAVFTAGE